MDGGTPASYHVVEFGQFIAVPTAGQTLSDAGNSLRCDLEHALQGHAVVVGSTIKMSGSKVTPAFPPRPLGADTAAILAELGYTQEQVAAHDKEEAIRAF